ncbi:hypothetical protein [Nocardia seriolae]|uniref:Uncharacterized protein n=1 Tax=Nocardia seriolae TaxID=37332 RepID=A0ABC8ASP7_9NOCA|nr:hypothetical protein [Nocardia seriolae]APA97321.1 hypothetical protein NS506_03268 [Nocardia seriolae]MTJ62230.1 hypothetical protein [Nocardia seriolae]MTJ74203.1 hypothetical protein [Nocardia seriolae]MTJ87139.1 hypothetical protein [Nocardia seriolae]MTK31133.1 hypothetical protein [Nocardia seriolae]
MSFLGGIFGSGRNRFGKKVLERVLGHDAVESARFDAQAYEIEYTLKNGYAAKLNLDTLYRRFDGKIGGALFEAVDRLLLPPDAPRGWEEVAPKLRPVLRPAGYGAVERRDGRGRALSRPALPYLSELVVIDLPRTVQFVTEHDLSRWGVDADTVYSIAHANLTDLAMNTLSAFDPPQGVRVLEFADDDGESYVGSLPLMAGWLAGVGVRTATRPLLFLPGHLGMFVVLGATPEILVQLMSLAAERYEAALRPLSTVPYTVDEEGEVVPLRVDAEHPAHPAIRRAEVRLAVGVYRAQAERLRAARDREGAIMELLPLPDPDGGQATMTSWPDRSTLLLPKADYICFGGPGGDMFRVRWDEVARLVDLALADDYDPPRYRVHGHPPADIMTRLRALSS